MTEGEPTASNNNSNINADSNALVVDANHAVSSEDSILPPVTESLLAEFALERSISLSQEHKTGNANANLHSKQKQRQGADDSPIVNLWGVPALMWLFLMGFVVGVALYTIILETGSDNDIVIEPPYFSLSPTPSPP